MTRPSFERSSDVRLLLEDLTAVAETSTITYVELARTVGRKTLHGGFPALQTALRIAQKDGIYFSNIRGEGYMRMPPAAVVKSSDGDIQQARRKLRRTSEKLLRTDYDALTPDQKRKFTTNLSVAGAIAHSLSTRNLTRIETTMTVTKREISMAEILKQFSSNT